MRTSPSASIRYRDLLEMFETTTKRHETRVAMRIDAMVTKSSNTYGPICANSPPGPAAFFASHEIKEWRSRDALQSQRSRMGHDYFGSA